ncbi:hypothetical protein ACFS07_32860 [Undibacterium arcticum]
MNPFVSIEMGGLMDTDVAAPFMEYAFFRVNQMLDGRPTLIYIEECWFMLANATFAARINDWLKTLRKKCFCDHGDTITARNRNKRHLCNHHRQHAEPDLFGEPKCVRAPGIV